MRITLRKSKIRGSNQSRWFNLVSEHLCEVNELNSAMIKAQMLDMISKQREYEIKK